MFSFPETPAQYIAIVVPSVALMKEELASLRLYLANGGYVLVCGPTCLPECVNEWTLPSRPELSSPEDFFDTIANGVSHRSAEWKRSTELAPSAEPCEWRECGKGIYYNPHRISDGRIGESLLSLVRSYITASHVEILSSEGYLITVFEKEDAINVHFLAEKYDTDIDHKLDEMRFHRSRVNYINKVPPIHVTETLVLRTEKKAKVYCPLSGKTAEVLETNGIGEIRLPPDTAYAIVNLK